MIVKTIVFNGSDGALHKRMAEILVRSSLDFSPLAPVEIHEVQSDDKDVKCCAREICKPTWIDNVRKLKHHYQIIQGAADGDVVAFLDADMMVIGDLSPLESYEFDLAFVTCPPDHPFKINTGLYAARVSSEIREWFGAWLAEAKRMLSNRSFHEHWQQNERYGGIHQAALGFMFHKWQPIFDLRLKTLDSGEWNDQSWMDGRARVIHVRDEKRLLCLNGKISPIPRITALARTWRRYDEILSTEKKESASYTCRQYRD